MKKEAERVEQEKELSNNKEWFKRMYILEGEIEELRMRNISYMTIFNDIHERIKNLERSLR